MIEFWMFFCSNFENNFFWYLFFWKNNSTYLKRILFLFFFINWIKFIKNNWSKCNLYQYMISDSKVGFFFGSKRWVWSLSGDSILKHHNVLALITVLWKLKILKKTKLQPFWICLMVMKPHDVWLLWKNERRASAHGARVDQAVFGARSRKKQYSQNGQFWVDLKFSGCHQ